MSRLQPPQGSTPAQAKAFRAGIYLGYLIALAVSALLWVVPFAIAGLAGVAMTYGVLAVGGVLGFVINMGRALKDVVNDSR